MDDVLKGMKRKTNGDLCDLVTYGADAKQVHLEVSPADFTQYYFPESSLRIAPLKRELGVGGLYL